MAIIKIYGFHGKKLASANKRDTKTTPITKYVHENDTVFYGTVGIICNGAGDVLGTWSRGSYGNVNIKWKKQKLY